MRYDIFTCLPNHWRIVRIEDVGQVVGGGTPSTKREDYYNGNIPWITPKDLSGYTDKTIKRGKRNITPAGLDNSSAKLLPQGSVLLSSRAPIGYVAIANNELATNQGFKSIICNQEKILSDYLYYVLSISKERLELEANGSTFKEVSGKVVKGFKIPLPPLKEQKYIIKVLSRMDTKIELNNNIISNLEETAQTLFKRWFVDFEYPNEDGKPYKSNGGKMVESEMGMIPEGWIAGTLNSIGKIVGGGTPSKKNKKYYTEKGYGWITPKDLSVNQSVYIYKGAMDITEEAIEKSSAKIHPKDTVLFSSRAPIGYIAIAAQKVSTNQGFKSIIPNEGFSSIYIYSLLKHLTPRIKLNAGGSTFKEISGKAMKDIETIIPATPILSLFYNVTKSFFDNIKYKENESKMLIELRDNLLPKLIAGEIELPDDVEVNEDVSVPGS